MNEFTKNTVNEGVKIWEETVSIPTYAHGEPNKNPMFLEKRVYQGSSGVVYPHPVVDKISDEKVDTPYDVVFLENKYIKIMVMPSLGGRIQMAYDKTNDYHFVYYNSVIKPALVGLAGPWISGGIEFNWPQHHRPSTFDPVDYKIEENEDGSMTLWVSEVERMFRTKGMAGFTLHPDKAYIEIKGQLYNRTAEPQTFLWWANPAVVVHDQYKSVFPPDVHAVFDHGKRDVSRFPIATGEYYKVDYSAGVDISMYKNIPVPTSYMAYHSDYDFVGCYDFKANAGLLHVADHHISPGKKQWTWGKGDFGIAWDRNLTDEDGPYIELMTGVYTDNQPDFTWLQPYEEKSFTQYFMPYKQTGGCTCATTDVITNLEFKDGKAALSVYATSEMNNIKVKLTGPQGLILDEMISCSPVNVFNTEIGTDSSIEACEYQLTITDLTGKTLLSYKPEKDEIPDIPDAAQAAVEPQEMKTIEELYLTGLHLEQYRHATFLPEDYYQEALKRDPSDARCNNAMGLLLYRRGKFVEAEEYFKAAVKKITWRNPNPYDGEAYYNQGLALRMQGKLDKAFDSFYKACWNAAWQDAGYFSLAQIASTQGKSSEALELVDKGLIRNWHNHKARHLKITLLRQTGETEKAITEAKLSLSVDPMDYGAHNELFLLTNESSYLTTLTAIMRNNVSNYIELALDYYHGGFYDEAIEVMDRILKTADQNDFLYPLVRYYLGFFNSKLGNTELAEAWYKEASTIASGCCFPNRLESFLVLQNAVAVNSTDAKAWYYLGNLWYGKRRHEEGRICWEESAKLDDTFPTVFRNLSLAYFNKTNEPEKALEVLEKAFELNTADSRVMFELDSLYKRLGRTPQQRYDFMSKYPEVVADRDDFYIEYITVNNLTGRHQQALSMIDNRIFHPWEGGEGKVTGQFITSLVELAKQAIKAGDFQQAIDLLKRTESYPHNLGEGKLAGAQENNINYFMGIAFEGLGDNENSTKYFIMASEGLSEPTSAMYYNDQPPEMIFYQGLALRKLGREDEARGRFNKLIAYGEKHLHDEVKIDYFAVSLPDFLIWEEDLNLRNEIHCRLLIALGNLGLTAKENDGNFQKAAKAFNEVTDLDKSHGGAKIHQQMLMDMTTCGLTFTKANASCCCQSQKVKA